MGEGAGEGGLQWFHAVVPAVVGTAAPSPAPQGHGDHAADRMISDVEDPSGGGRGEHVNIVPLWAPVGVATRWFGSSQSGTR